MSTRRRKSLIFRKIKIRRNKNLEGIRNVFRANLIISCRLSQAGRLFLTTMNSLSSPLSCIKKISVWWIRIRWIHVGSSSGSGSRSLLFIKDLKNFLKKRFNLYHVKSLTIGQCCGSGSGTGSTCFFGSISQRYGSGSGSFPFSINVLSGLK